MTLAKVLCNWPCSFWCAFCASDRDVRSKTEIDPSPKWRPQIQLTLWVLFVLETNKAITWNANAACHLTVSEPHTMSILALTSPSLLFDAGSVLVMSPSWGLLGLQLGSFYWHVQPNPTPSSSFYLSGKWSRFCSLIKFIVCDGSWLSELCKFSWDILFGTRPVCGWLTAYFDPYFGVGRKFKLRGKPLPLSERAPFVLQSFGVLQIV